MLYDVKIEVSHIEANSEEDARAIVKKKLLTSHKIYKFMKSQALKITGTNGDYEIIPRVSVSALPSNQFTIKSFELESDRCVEYLEYRDGVISLIDNKE